jgi:hypothetical protein
MYWHLFGSAPPMCSCKKIMGSRSVLLTGGMDIRMTANLVQILVTQRLGE